MLKLEYDELLSIFALNFKLRRYKPVPQRPTPQPMYAPSAAASAAASATGPPPNSQQAAANMV
jgi:hypothetical protein